jgi:hypothetical protein
VRKFALMIGALVALVALSLAAVAAGAGGNAPVTVTQGNLKLTANGGFSPTVLPKKGSAPIGLTAEGKIQTLNGEHPPAVQEVVLETPKSGTIQVKGYPTCTSGQLQATDTKTAEKTCGSAIIGSGKTTIQIQFAEQNPINVQSKLLVINGGEAGGTVTLFIHAYITVPTPAAVVTTVKIKKHVHGRFGYTSVATIPKIAGGNGSVTSFNLKIDKKYTYKGKKVSVLSAKCTDGKLAAHATAILSDGTKASAEIIRPCTPKG